MSQTGQPYLLPRRAAARQATLWALVLSSMISTPVLSAQTDISSAPITSTNAAQVKPNIMLLMDTSGSMGWGHMPDEVGETTNGAAISKHETAVGYKAAQCNVLYYNRTQTYAIPKTASGDFPTPSFTAARYDAFDTGSSTVVNLATSFKAYDSKQLRAGSSNNYDDTEPPQAAYYYYKTGGSVPITAYNASPCLDDDLGATIPSSDGGTWNRVIVGASSGVGATDERLNFAIWYAYYRTRILLIKSAASLAFSSLTDSYRVGFITVKPKDSPTATSINQDKYLAINDFNTTQRGLWFSKLFAQKPGGSSPAREGLARVGRHYAGKQDGINEGMTGDPVQYSCQQNFTIMTTDGYWNAQDESSGLGSGFIGGAVDATGKALVGQRDGNLNSFSTNNPSPPPATDVNVTPRPIWDGTFSGIRTITTKTNRYAYQPCGSYFSLQTSQVNVNTSQRTAQTRQQTRATAQRLQSTQQALQTTSQMTRSTSQTAQSTVQNRASTNQNLQNRVQRLRSTTQTTSSTLQNRRATSQNLQSTTQNLQSTSQTFEIELTTQRTVRIPRQTTMQNLRSTTQNLQSTSQQNQQSVQNLRSTTQNLRSTSVERRSTSQTTQNTAQNLRSTAQNLQSTAQATQSTTQTTRSTSQTTASTSQTLRSTSQQTTTTSQTRRSTSQMRSCDASTELCTPGPVGSCTPGGNITCETVTTGPTLVASCTPQSANAGNNYTTTTCSTTGSGPTPTASCTPSSPVAGNAYTTTTCATATTGPTAVSSCAPTSGNSGNAWTTTTCSNSATGPTAVASCTPQAAAAGNNWTTTTCGSNTTGPTVVASCTPQSASAGNSWTATTCGTSSTTNVPVASCTASGPTAGNNYTTTTCGSNNTSNVAVASCSPSTASAGNSWTTTTCATNNSGPTPVASCAPSSASSGNGWTTTSCSTNNTSTPSGTCSASGATAGNNWTTTTCPTVTTGPTAVDPAACTPATGDAGNAWTTTTCPVTNTGPTAVASCTNAAAAAGNGWVATSCSTNNTSNVPVASCTASGANSGNGFTTTTCSNNNSAVTPVSSCTPVAPTAGNNFTATTCPVANTGPTAVASCSASPASSGNSWTATTCSNNNTSNVPVSSCTASSASSGNGWTTTTCSTNNATNTAVASCTPSGPTSGNGWVTTTCPAETVVSGPTNVASCTPDPATSANGFQRTDCSTSTNQTPVQQGTCVPEAPSAANNFVRTSCNTVTTANVPVASCTPQTAAAGNQWLDITCATNNTSNVPVDTCTAQGPTAGNGYTTTTCPAPATTGPTPVASCTPVAASAGNAWTTTTCPTPVTTGPTGVAACVNIPASAVNNWTATICGSNNTSNVGVASCTDSIGSSGNAWTTTTCSDNNATNTPVATCAPQTGSAGNAWVTLSCPAPATTTNVPVASCTPEAASAGNNFTSRTCNTNNTTNVPSGSCVPSAASAANNWTTTTCPVLTTGPTGVASCTASSGNAGNNWVTTSCNPVDTSNVAVASCSPSGPTAGNGYTTTTCTANNTSSVPVASCTASSPNAGNGYTTTSCADNNQTVPVAACTPSGPTAGNGWTTTTCPINDSGVVGASSCVPSGPTAANNWTTTTCPGIVTTGPTPAASCTGAPASAANNWTATSCSIVDSQPSIVTSCSPVAASAGNNWTATSCTPVSGNQQTTTVTTRVQQFNISGGVQASTGTDVTSTVGPSVTSACYAPASQPALPPDSPPAWTSSDASAYPSCSGWPCTVDTNTGNPRSINSLADVAQYYYITDLRTVANEPRGIDYYRDDVPAVGNGPEDDRVRWQHMTTFSIALGVSGSLQYRSDYKSATTGDFADIRSGAKDWPLWPDPTPGYYSNAGAYNDPRSIDDFWHTAVNGRGTYFSAGNPTSVIAGLAGALAGISARVASSSGVAVSNQEPVTGDNFAYVSNYTTQQWSGDLQAREIDINTGAVQPTIIWSAQDKLNAATSSACDNRKIYLMRQGATDNLTNFSWNSKACDGSGNPSGSADTGLNSTEQAHFGAGNVGLLSQHPNMTTGSGGTPDQRSLAAGANLVNFLRGQRGLEDFTAGSATRLYRKRDAALGDTVNGQPVYVRAPFASYSDAGYAAYKSAQAGRAPMLYVPANDGMLHAFYAGTSPTDVQGGKEAWAVVPSSVLPNLYHLADFNYGNTHRYSVDGTPSVGDVYDGSTWKTVLVGGLNAGGRGFYALDVTNPAAPKGLWEFKWSDTCYDPANTATAGADCHLGLSFGRPIISKLADGRWVVMVTSGYNNVNATPKTGDGGGYLYVLNATTGQIIYKIGTGAGNATTPSGLAQINNYVDKAEINNTTVRVYGADLLGNIWRFDVNNNTAPSGREATLVGTARDPGGVGQPITVRPELTQVGGKPMLFVATGRLLGATDVSDLQVQSIYGIVDPIKPTTAFANLRTALAPLAMTQLGSGTGATRTIACTGSTAECGSTDGWRVDLPDSGERVNVEMKLRSGTLVIGSNVPQISACSSGGYSWLSYLNYKSGLAVTGAPGLAVSEQVANSLIVGLSVIKLRDGTIRAVGTFSDGGVLTRNPPTSSTPPTVKRTTWREVTF